jgi:site-specific DNA recombinase
VFRRFVRRRDSLGAIARWLRRAAAPRRRSWTAADVRQLLSSPTYAGGVPGQAEHPALIDGAVWRRAQEILAARARHGRSRESRYLLSGLLRCRKCGAAMTGHRHRRASPDDRREIANYECSRKRSEPRRCRGSHISAVKAHRLLCENLRALSDSQRPGEAPAEFAPGRPGGEPPAAELRGRLSEYPRRLEALLRSFREGRLPPADYAQERRRLESERRRLEQSLLRADGRRRAPSRPQADGPPICGMADVLESDRFGTQMKKDLLWEAFDHLTIDREGTVRLWVRV